MALVSVTEAAKLVRRGRATLYRDIEKGRLSKSVSEHGETKIETSELARAYGRLYEPETNEPVRETTHPSSINEFSDKVDSWKASSDGQLRRNETAGDAAKTQILEERIKSLERILELEAELRKVKDAVTDELRARLLDKDAVIKTLESQVMLLEYTKPVAVTAKPNADVPSSQERRGFWAKIMRIKRR